MAKNAPSYSFLSFPQSLSGNPESVVIKNEFIDQKADKEPFKNILLIMAKY
jgi:hypothetical protein